MKQHSLGLGMTAKRTRRREFLDEMEIGGPKSRRPRLLPDLKVGSG